MRSLRVVVLLAAGLALPVSLLSACTGSDDPVDSRDPSTTATSDETVDPTTTETASGGTGEPGFPLITGDPCKTTIKVTGAVDQRWDAEGAVALSKSGPTATYQTSDGATVLTAYAEGNGFQETFILSVGLDTYAPAPGSGGLDVADDGSGATIDADASGTTGDVHVTASITC